jgi:hypothetical protein
VIVQARLLASQHKYIAAPSSAFGYAPTPAEATAAVGGRPVINFVVSFPSGQPTWTWSQATGTWLRSQYGKKETDATDGKQLHATNVVVLKVKIDRSFKNFKYGYIPRTVVIGGGTGYVFSGGKTIAVTFKKANQTDPIHLFDKAGNPVLLEAGNTWIELMPSDAGSINVKYLKVAPTATPSATK